MIQAATKQDEDRFQIYSCTVIHIGILWPSQHIIEIKIILPENESSDLKGLRLLVQILSKI